MELYPGYHCIEVFHENPNGAGYMQESRMCATPSTADIIYESLTKPVGMSKASMNPKHVSLEVFMGLMKTLKA
jgi:hypothetical protein